MKRTIAWTYVTLVCLLALPQAAARTIEFTTNEVTDADVAVSPDGRWLIFTILGHLFRLPVTGGTAEQLTFGPYYDSDPVFSSDGKRVAFISARNGNEGNIFVLELATGQITQVARESWATRPNWSPDGQSIVYLSLMLEASDSYGTPLEPAVVRRVFLTGNESETISAPPRPVSSVFYLSDGRLAWTVIELEAGSSRWITRIEVMSELGLVSPLRTLEGRIWSVVASPTGDGLYCRRDLPVRTRGAQPEDLLFIPLSQGGERRVASLHWDWASRPRFAVAADNKTLYLWERGRIWKLALQSRFYEPVPFSAKVRLEIQDPVRPLKATLTNAGGSAPPRIILHPRLSPDGRTLVFGAASHLWQQLVDGGLAHRLTEGCPFESWPAFSPDGRRLAFLCDQNGKRELRIFSFDSGQTRTLTTGLMYRDFSWSSDGQRIVFAEGGEDQKTHLVAMSINNGQKEEFLDIGPAGPWAPRSPRPHFSSDGHSLYFSARARSTGIRTLYRLPLQEQAKPEPVTQLARHLSDVLVSPDGTWIAFRRIREIWVAPLGKEPVREKDVRLLSSEGGDTFAFTPEGSALIYAVGNTVRRHPLAGGEFREIPIGLELAHPNPPPVLLRRVRVLDLAGGSFSSETSLFIEEGRIRWIGLERGRKLPPGTISLDAGGRFVIPGLSDLHVHAEGANQAAFVAYGVTTVRSTGDWLAWMNSLADRSESTGEPLPRYFFAGDIFDGTRRGVSLDWTLFIENEEDARTYVRLWKKQGVHFLKVYQSLMWPLQRAVAEEARRQGLPVAGHGTSTDVITKSVTLGYWTLEHTPANNPYDDVLQMLAAAGTRWDPTLGTMGGNEALLLDEPERLADAKSRAFAVSSREGRPFPVATGTWSPAGWPSILMAYRRGVKLQAGTDTYQGDLIFPGERFPGLSLHWELEHFAHSGLSPLEALRIATRDAAEAIGVQDDLGTVEPGKLADMVLLDKNPLEDIRNTQTIWRVLKGGWVFDPQKLRPLASPDPHK